METYATADAARSAGMTYHLTPTEVWERQRDGPLYVPEGFEREGFIHATNGLDPLLDVANLFYVSDGRPFCVLQLDVGAIRAAVRYDDPEELYPHIFGPLNTDAVVGTMTAHRSTEGRFVRFGEGA